MRKLVSHLGCFAIIVTMVGCSQESTKQSATATVNGTKFTLSDEPQGAKEVAQVREDAKDGDDVVIVGRIGGGENPWIKDRAAFTIVDNSLKACSDIPGDKCETPWDYCCETPKLPSSTALVKVVNEDGKLVQSDARQLLNVKELSTVVVRGKAKRDDEGNLTVLASGIYVKKK